MKERVEQVITKIRPMLQRDGGDIELVDVTDGVVKVKLTGACGSCPMSMMTLKMGVENALKKEIPEVKEVILTQNVVNPQGEITPHAPDVGLAIQGPPLLHLISLLKLKPKLIPEFFELPFDGRGAEPRPTNEYRGRCDHQNYQRESGRDHAEATCKVHERRSPKAHCRTGCPDCAWVMSLQTPPEPAPVALVPEGISWGRRNRNATIIPS